MGKKIIVILMILSCLGMGAYLVVEYNNEDRKGPEISFAEESIVYDENTDSEAVLLEDVTAKDDVDGDVSDSLRVESVYQSNDKEAIVVYVARDKHNNITKRKRIVDFKAMEAQKEKKSDSDDSEE